MNLEREMAKDSRIVVIYDGDCPLCSAYMRMTRLTKAVGRPTQINARERPELVKALADNGVNLDEGMAVYYRGRLYAGSDAVNVLALLTTPVDVGNRIAATVLGRPRLARTLYPLLRASRNLLLKLKRKSQLTATPCTAPAVDATIKSSSSMDSDVS